MASSKLKIQIARKNQREEILDYLMKYFRVEEPTCRALNFPNDEGVRKLFMGFVDPCLKMPTSCLVINEDETIVGCLLTKIVDFHVKDDNDKISYSGYPYSDILQKWEDFLDLIHKDLDKLLPPETKRVLFGKLLSVRKDYQKIGVGKEMAEFCLKLAADFNCDYAYGQITALNSQKLFNKLNFDTLRVIEYSDFRDETTNEQIIQCDDGTTCAKLVVKRIDRRL